MFAGIGVPFVGHLPAIKPVGLNGFAVATCLAGREQ
jgi:hypothetical protein